MNMFSRFVHDNKVALPALFVSTGISVVDFFEWGWRGITVIITLMVFYFQWRKHKREEEKHRREMERQDRLEYEHIMKRKQHDSRNT
jgi:hypothetical protein